LRRNILNRLPQFFEVTVLLALNAAPLYAQDETEVSYTLKQNSRADLPVRKCQVSAALHLIHPTIASYNPTGGLPARFI